METQGLFITIPDKLFAPAESLSFSGTYPSQVIELGPDTYRATEPITWNVQVTNTGGALLVEGAVEASLQTECARCLEPAFCKAQGAIEGYVLIPGEEGQGFSEDEEEEFEVLGEDNVVDLEPYLLTALLLELPNIPLCKPDCLGLCPRCGDNLNEGPCGCQSDDDIDPLNPFAALKNFKFD